MNKHRLALAVALAISVIALGGCGGSNASGAASCLKNALNLGGGQGPCVNPNSPGAQAANSLTPGFGGPSAQSASCVNQTGNEYQCTVTLTDGSQQSYSVTYDGKTIAYSQAS